MNADSEQSVTVEPCSVRAEAKIGENHIVIIDGCRTEYEARREMRQRGCAHPTITVSGGNDAS